MNTTLGPIIGIKELQLNLKRVADAVQKGASFTVVRDSKVVFKIIPAIDEQRTGTLLDAYNAVKFQGPRDLSKQVDAMVYGNSR
jgi:antitoxin (DNA-binding transcriptional repressor) of toxin-antitoxin stability system